MDCLNKEKLKQFHRLSSASLTVSTIVVATCLTAASSIAIAEPQQFLCHTTAGETVTASVQEHGYEDYSLQNGSQFPLYACVLSDFLPILLVSFMYQALVDTNKQKLTTVCRRCKVSTVYIGVLLFKSLVLAISVPLQWGYFYPVVFPTKHNFTLPQADQVSHPGYNYTKAANATVAPVVYNCKNRVAVMKSTLSIVLFVIRCLVLLLSLFEMRDLWIKIRHFKHGNNGSRSFLDDDVFCQQYLGMSEHCQGQSNEDIDLQSGLMNGIRTEYERRGTYLQPFPWCENFQLSTESIYTRLKILSRTKERSQLTDQIVNMYDIFQQQKSKNPKVVLVEGDPGIGKTTFCLKLSLDWSKGNTKEPFPHFKLLFLLKCREMRTANVRDAIVDQLLPREATEEETDAFFENLKIVQPNILLIFDGLDELRENIAVQDLVDSRQRDILSRSYVLVTSRHEAGLKVRGLCDTLLEVVGFTKEDAEEYIRKYFEGKEEMANDLVSKIHDGELEELISSPLNTALICSVFEDNGDLPSTRSELYNKMVHYILKRSFVKQGKNLPNEPFYGCQKELATLGKLALQGIKEDKLSFEESELGTNSEAIASMGFLSKEESSSKLNPKSLFGFMHKTFQEYFAAFYLSDQLVNREVTGEDFIQELSTEREKFTQVFVFMAGILAGKGASAPLVLFMESLSRYLSTLVKIPADEYNKDQYVMFSFMLLCDCVAECSNVQLEVQKQLCAVIGRNISWEKLRLDSCFYSESSVFYRMFCEVFKHNTTIKQLHLPNNNISDYIALAKLLKENRTLEELDLPYNNISDCRSLAESLKENRTLEWLNLSSNKISDCSSLAESLKENRTLKWLHLSYNNISDCSSLAESLKENRALQELYLYGNPISDKTPLQELEQHNKHLALRYDK